MMLLLYTSKKELKAAIGQRLKYRETSMHGPEYKADGSFTGAHRPSIDGITGREFFATVTMEKDLIKKVE